MKYNNNFKLMQNTIREKIKEAMIAKDPVKLNVFRGILSAFTNELVAKGKTPQDTLTDDECITVIKRLAKQRKDSIEQFEKGGRPELAAAEKEELVVIETLLPASMSKEDIKKIAEAKKAEMGLTDKTKMGMLMGAVIKETKGAADGADVKQIVEELFA
jgi:uncharacterized protein YqeY